MSGPVPSSSPEVLGAAYALCVRSAREALDALFDGVAPPPTITLRKGLLFHGASPPDAASSRVLGDAAAHRSALAKHDRVDVDVQVFPEAHGARCGSAALSFHVAATPWPPPTEAIAALQPDDAALLDAVWPHLSDADLFEIARGLWVGEGDRHDAARRLGAARAPDPRSGPASRRGPVRTRR